MKSIIICLLLTLALCQQHSDAHQLTFHSNLKFRNSTGPGVTPQQMSLFISVANYASRVYGDDVLMNLKYIKSRMDSFYGDSTANFYVFIQTDQDVYGGNAYTLDDVYAEVQGINELYPKWSYYFTLYWGNKSMSTYSYIHAGVGSGFTQNLVEITKSTIMEQQGDSCTCQSESVSAIRDALNAQINRDWFIICANTDTTHSLARSYLNRWIYIQPKNCYYTIFG